VRAHCLAAQAKFLFPRQFHVLSKPTCKAKDNCFDLEDESKASIQLSWAFIFKFSRADLHGQNITNAKDDSVATWIFRVQVPSKNRKDM